MLHQCCVTHIITSMLCNTHCYRWRERKESVNWISIQASSCWNESAIRKTRVAGWQNIKLLKLKQQTHWHLTLYNHILYIIQYTLYIIHYILYNYKDGWQNIKLKQQTGWHLTLYTGFLANIQSQKIDSHESEFLSGAVSRKITIFCWENQK